MGSYAVPDAWKYGEPKDVDVVLASWSIGEYLFLIINKSRIEAYLRRILGRDVNVAPLLLWMPTVIGNVYLLLHAKRCREILEKYSFLYPLLASRVSKRWLLLLSFYAFLGMICSIRKRDLIKYAVMMADSLIIYRRMVPPRRWNESLRRAYIISKRLGLRYHEELFKQVMKLLIKMQHEPADVKLLHELAPKVLKERLVLLDVNIDNLEYTIMTKGLVEEPLRAIHEFLYRLLGRRIRWRKAVRILVRTISYVLLNKNPKKELVCKAYALCKDQVPVLSPFAHP